MKLLHVSDTHVGFAAYSRVTPEGLNAREQDFFDAFRRAIDVALEKRVDVVLHSGDLFDSVRPTNRALHHVMDQCRRLHEAGIPFVVISGNHEAPRLRETGAVLRLLEFIPGVRAVYKGKTEVVRVGDLAIHATPHAADNDALLAQLRAVRPAEGARWNVAALHAGVVGVGDFRTGEFHEQVVPQNEIPPGMDYVALGHYHRAVEVAPKVWYAGSTERCTFKECGETKSVNLVDLARGTVTPLSLPARRMEMLPPVRCEGMAEADAPGAVYDALGAADLQDAIARLRVTGIPAHVHATLDFRRVKQLTQGAFHFDLQPEIVRRENAGVVSAALGSLEDEFEGFLSQRTLGADRDAVLREAKALLASAAGGDPK
ncbi:MAG: repair protein SbcD/Mre11 [Thermoplasmata archaeon]|jgi:DNA repair exonuclease SbcCD nuclease subunit|nr:repair protein SbcD/Mre11 [Thermoplasmata archaeon]